MHLKALDLNGFKSFALPTHLEFNPGVTAVVGPNGSGKSNVADAVRWVLGEMSLKTLRGKKSEDVIFAGSGMRAAHSMAEVTLTFDNADGRLPVDAAEVAISRRIFRDGTSEYEINAAKVRLMDIHELLIKAGLGERSYAVIGQGQVDDILRASPAERKEFFEEAAGVKQFQIKKESTLRKLETTRRNLIRVDDLVQEIRPRLNSLKRQAERAALREEIEKELTQTSLTWFGAELAAIDTAAAQDITALEKITAQRQKLEAEITALEKSHAAAGQAALEGQRRLLEQRIDQARQNISEFDQVRADVRRRQASLQEKELPLDLAMLPAQIAEIETQMDRLMRRAATLVPQVDALRNQVSKAERESEKTAKQVATLRAKLTEQRPGRALDHKEIAKLVKEIQQGFDRLLSQLQKVQTAPDLARLADMATLAEQPRQQLDVLAAKVKRSEPIDMTQLNQELDRVLEARDGILAELAGSREQLATRETEHKFLSKQIAELQTQLKNLKAQLVGAKKSGAAGAKKAALEAIKSELTDIEQRLATEDEQLRSLQHEQAQLDTEVTGIRKKTLASEEHLADVRHELASTIEQQGQLNVAKGKFDVRREDLLGETKEFLGEERAKSLARGGADALTPDARTKLKAKIDALRKKLEQAGGIDETVMQEYRETNERFEFLSTQSKDLAEASDKLREVIHELDQKIHRLFFDSLTAINVEFDRAFKVLFSGGTAKLLPLRPVRKVAQPSDAIDAAVDAAANSSATARAATDRESPLTPEDEVTREVERLRESDTIAGVDIKATPPGKKLQTIGMLSGGEKALTSIALLSGILATKPSPFVILDEVDAALDEANSRRFARIIKSLAAKTQFITITHNRETMRHAGILYGVTMQKDGVSKLLSVKLDSVDSVVALR